MYKAIVNMINRIDYARILSYKINLWYRYFDNWCIDYGHR